MQISDDSLELFAQGEYTDGFYSDRVEICSNDGRHVVDTESYMVQATGRGETIRYPGT